MKTSLAIGLGNPVWLRFETIIDLIFAQWTGFQTRRTLSSLREPGLSTKALRFDPRAVLLVNESSLRGDDFRRQAETRPTCTIHVLVCTRARAHTHAHAGTHTHTPLYISRRPTEQLLLARGSVSASESFKTGSF